MSDESNIENKPVQEYQRKPGRICAWHINGSNTRGIITRSLDHV